jgi:acyl transferase domain-containing protein
MRVDVVQPALFAVAVSLAELWRACGVRPDAVVGHSHGEIAAAHVARGLSLRDAARVVALRSRALVGLPKGGVVAVSLGARRIGGVLEGWGDRLTLAAVNGPSAVAVSGDREALKELLQWCAAEGVGARRVPIDYASHSPQVEAIREDLLAALSPVTACAGEIPFYSSLSGARHDTAELDAEYWYRSERDAVRFEQAMAALLSDGQRTFIEVSPHPVLTTVVQENLDAHAAGERAPSDALVVGSLRRDQGGPQRFLDVVAQVRSHGVDLDWEAACRALGMAPVERSARAAPPPQPDAPGRWGPTNAMSETPPASLARRLASASGAEQGRVLLAAVLAEVAGVLGSTSPQAALAPGRAFSELGLDSSAAVELRNRLRAATGLALTSTLLFDHPTPAALAAHLLGELTGVSGAETSGATGMQTPTAGGDERIALVGIGCRFPGGVRSPRDLWELVSSGGDAIADFPTDRGWDLDALYDPDPDRSGASYAREGGFLRDAALFDADFFGISPREAQAMDPQQRLLLETSWEALEHADIDPHSLKDGPTGVYVGISALEYDAAKWLAPDGLEGYGLTSTAGGVLSGRVAYALGLRGPAVTVDTACSSSLVALHLACGALRTGECALVLAGGVNVMITPGMFTAFSRQRALAADGRCKSFAAAADGTGWSEGVGVLVLERLADARRNGHRVLALVRGSAINQDGASNGLTAPNGLAQQQVIGQALASAGLAAAAVDAVEGHGTGTRLGDPIEAQALLASYGRERPPERPLWLGSVKSNIGHAQAAAGMAGVIKMAMALRRGVLPRTLHVDEPSREVDWSAGAVSLLRDEVPWPRSGRPRYAGVSSFGISGTNAHVILEEAPSLEEAPDSVEAAPGAGVVPRGPSAEAGGGGALPWVLSAVGPEALRAQAERLRTFVVADPALGIADVGLALAGRARLAHRAVILGEDREQLLEGVHALAAGEPAANIVAGVEEAESGRLAFLFTGQGAQRVGMGRELYERFTVFREAFDEVCARLDGELGCSLRAVVFGDPPRGERARDPGSLDATELTQTGLFALEVALFRLLDVWGVRPDYLMGHSVGELVAAHVGGALSLADACRLVATRGRLMGELPAGGAMVAVQASEREALESLVGRDDRVALAAVNGPCAVVLSGDEDAVLEQASAWEQRGRKVKRLRVSHAFHSPRMEAMLVEFERVARELSCHEPAIPVVSNLSGRVASAGEPCDAGYWVRHAREPVRFADGVRWLAAQDVGCLLELGPDGVLSAMARESLDPEGSFTVAPVLRAGAPAVRSLLGALAQAWVRGVGVDWAEAFAGIDARRVELPTYAFQRERYWLAPARLEQSAAGPARERAVADGWRYRVRWQPTGGATGGLSGTWLVAVPPAASSEHVGAGVIGVLERRGARVARVEVDGVQARREELATRLRDALDGEPPAGVLSLLACDERPHGELAGAGPVLAGSLTLVQALADAEIAARLWIATCGAVSASAADRVEHPLQATLWGLGRVLRLEDPERWGGLIDLPGEPDECSLRSLGDVLAAQGGEDELAVRPSGVHARRLERAPLGGRAGRREWRPAGTVLVTGGTGALGGHVARWLARGGAEHIVLASRRGPDAPGAGELRAELAALGARVTIAACDVAEREQLRELLASAISGEGALAGVFHVAGVIDGELIDALSMEQVERVLAPKVQAAWHLHELTEPLEPQAFVLFSSLAATLGGVRQAAYAAGNAFLDALAGHRRARGLAATAVAWGTWEGAGMAGDVAARMRRRGLRELPVEPALAALQQALDHDEANVTIADLDWERYAPVFDAVRPYRSIGELPEVLRLARTGLGTEPTGGGDSLVARLAAVPEGAARERVVVELVCTHAAFVLGHASSETVPAERAFKDLGLDSLAAVELRNRLAAATGLRLPTTLIFDHPTPARAAAALLAALAGTRGDRQAVAVPARRVDEPLAIVGMACRYPGGVRSPLDMWELLAAGGDAISSFPTDRGWDIEALYDPDPDSPGTSYAREGGFLTDAGDFDADFFGIGPREALAMDPQQRLLLEACWEALEHGGIDPSSLRGTPTGVFAGLAPSGYGSGSATAHAGVEGYRLTGSIGSVASGRVAYVLGLEGPAVSVDTACSSSLVALHLAGQALRGGECSLALAGGVAVLATPELFVEFARQRGLAGDGRCKAFADAADGTAWSEGVGVLLIERLTDARRNGHRVLALVRGSAINQDGTSNGLTAPNGPSQERVIRQALANAGLSASEIDAVEGHGTGTTLGDPIEARALLATYGQDRPEGRPLWLGSIKSNIGHPAAAAGVAGVIKMAMALQRGRLPQTLHMDEPSRQVDWSAGTVALLRNEVPWLRNGKPRRAGVSSFGISGTNAHVLLEEAPLAAAAVGDRERPPIPGDRKRPPGIRVLECDVTPWVLSGGGPRALRAQAERLRARVAGTLERGVEDVGSAGDVGLSLAGRPALADRAVVLGGDREELLLGLETLVRGEPADVVTKGVAGAGGGIVFLFPGQGSQWIGMAAELLERSPVFAERIAECGRALAPFVDWSLEGVLRGEDGMPGLERVDVVQPALFAVMVSLAELWRACGVEPDVVVGHSQGEIAAACVAGGLSLRDAARVVAVRSRALAALAGRGGMVSVSLGVGELTELARSWGERIAIAAINGPASVVVSGEPQALKELLRECEVQGVRARSIPVDYAAHSAQVEAVREELLAGCAGIAPRASAIAFYSTAAGEMLDTAELDCEYWYRNLRQTVRFEQVTQALVKRGQRTFIEVSPHPVLTVGVQETIDALADTDGIAGARRDVGVIGSLRRDDGGPGRWLTALAEAWVRGVAVDWRAVFRGSDAQQVELPTYAFQRERYWLAAAHAGGGAVSTAGLSAAGHPLLGAAVALAEGRGWLFTAGLSLESYPWLADHAALGVVLLPGTAFLELALHVGREVGSELVQELVLKAPLTLQAGELVQVQIAVAEPDEQGHRTLDVHSRIQRASGAGALSEDSWTHNATGTLAPDLQGAAERTASDGLAPTLAAAVWPPADAVEIGIEGLYERLRERGLDYGPAFQGLRAAWRRGADLFAEVALPDAQGAEARLFGLHPALLDAALHITGVEARQGSSGAVGQTEPRLPFAWSGVRLYAAGASHLRVQLAPAGGEAISLEVADDSGARVASVQSLATRPISREQLDGSRSASSDSLFKVAWMSVVIALVSDGAPERWAVVGAEDGELVRALRAAGAQPRVYPDVDALGKDLDAGVGAPELVLASCTPPAASEAADAAGGETVGAGEGASAELAAAAHGAAQRALELVQSWIADQRLGRSRLVLVTTRSLAALAGEEVPGLVQAPVWGLLRVAQTEHPERFVAVDVDGAESSWQALPGALATGEPQLALRAGQALVPRLTRVSPPPAQASNGNGSAAAHARWFDPQRAVLITGGTGLVGGLVARQLVRVHGVRDIVLASRQGLSAEGAAALEAELSALGARARVVRCDVSDRGQLAALLGSMPTELPLGAVVHAAGALEDGVLHTLTPERLDRVLAPKVDAALHLHELTEHLDLSAFVLFSAGAGVLGLAGQANYAAANTFLDALASHRRARGLPGASLAWGLWEQASEMSRHLREAQRSRLAGLGVVALRSEQGLELFDAAQELDEALLAPLRLDAGVLRARASAGELPPMLRGLVAVPTSRAGQGADLLARRLSGASTAERERIVLELTLAHIATVLGHSSPQALDPQRALRDLGFDSLAAVELRNRLAADTGLRLPATLAFDHPTAAAVSERLLHELAWRDESSTVTLEDELVELERRLAAIATDAARRSTLATRLRAFLSDLDGERAAVNGDEDVRTATADEVFELIDRELGSV